MKVEKINIGRLQLLCAVNPSAKEIAYILYPMDALNSWIGEAARRFGVSIVVITGFDWDNDLTPWPAPGEPKGSADFKGDAPKLLNTLATTVVPEIERRYGISENVVRSLVGVSLSGLFALWQWPQCDMFLNIATLSGSFWYEGFVQWIYRQSFEGKSGVCYMLLGSEEPHSNVPAFRKVGECTEKIARYLRKQGVDLTYDIVAGNHFQHGIERLNKAFAHIYPTGCRR